MGSVFTSGWSAMASEASTTDVGVSSFVTGSSEAFSGPDVSSSMIFTSLNNSSISSGSTISSFAAPESEGSLVPVVSVSSRPSFDQGEAKN